MWPDAVAGLRFDLEQGFSLLYWWRLLVHDPAAWAHPHAVIQDMRHADPTTIGAIIGSRALRDVPVSALTLSGQPVYLLDHVRQAERQARTGDFPACTALATIVSRLDGVLAVTLV